MSRLFFVIGVLSLLTAFYLIWQRSTPLRLSFDTETLGQQSAFTPDKAPVRIEVRSLNISLPIVPTELQEGKWTATDRGVSYLTSTAVPGERGNSILYGHNWPNLLGPLTRAKPGQEIDIFFADGEVRRFVIEYTSVVTPDQTHILNPTPDSRLTLYTCTGFLDRKRFVVTAVPKQYPNADQSELSDDG